MNSLSHFLVLSIATTSLLSCGGSKSSSRGNIKAAQPQGQAQAQNQTNHAAPLSPEGKPLDSGTPKSSYEGGEESQSTSSIKDSSQLIPGVYGETGLNSIRRLITEDLAQNNKGKEREASDFSKSIKNFDITIDTTNNRVILTLTLEQKPISLAGFIDSTGVARIKATSSNQIEAKVICLDRIETQCFTALVKLKDLSRNGVTSLILSQKTNANFNFKALEASHSSSPLKTLSDYLLNTEKRSSTNQSIRSILVETFEVIGAKAATRIAFIARDGEVIKVQGPLLKSLTGSELTNIPLEVSYEFYDLVPFEEYVGDLKSNLAETISEVALIQYNTQEKMTLSFRYFEEGKYDETLKVELFRIRASLKNINQVKIRL